MASECPVKNCEEVTEIRHTLYGKEGKGGLVHCLNKFLTKKTAWTLFSTIGIVLIGYGIKTWSGQESDPLRYVDKDSFAQCERAISDRISNAEKKLDSVHVTQGYLIDAIAEIKKGRQELKNDMKENNTEQKEALKAIFRKLHEIELALPRGADP